MKCQKDQLQMGQTSRSSPRHSYEVSFPHLKLQRHTHTHRVSSCTKPNSSSPVFFSGD